MVEIINGINHFSVNGKRYPKIYQAIAMGENSIAIYNIHDIRNKLLSTTHYTQVKVNGNVLSNQDELLQSLIPILYSEKEIIDNTTIGNDRVTASPLPPSGVPQEGEEWVIYDDTV